MQTNNLEQQTLKQTVGHLQRRKDPTGRMSDAAVAVDFYAATVAVVTLQTVFKSQQAEPKAATKTKIWHAMSVHSQHPLPCSASCPVAAVAHCPLPVARCC